MNSINNTRIEAISPLLSPKWFKHEAPLDASLAKHVAMQRQQVEAIIHRGDPRLLVVVGPCSVHDVRSAKEYAERLAVLAKKFSNSLCIIMRTYFEKPRTTIGWKGLINDPTLDNRCDINLGLKLARQLLVDVNQLGLGVATEFLDCMTPQYLADLICWAAIGARTTESQVHRNLASGLSMPVGFKNGTTGNIKVAADAVIAARDPHHFLSLNDDGLAAIVDTTGNKSCHLILRGGSDSGPNYSAEHVGHALGLLTKNQLPLSVMIDCSHGNSQKDYRRQEVVLADVMKQIAMGNQAITGVMIESFLNAGNQSLNDPTTLAYGKSITDPCLGFSETERLLTELADVISRHRV